MHFKLCNFICVYSKWMVGEWRIEKQEFDYFPLQIPFRNIHVVIFLSLYIDMLVSRG